MKIPRGRLDAVEKLYLEGRSPHAIQRDLAAQFGVSHRAIRRYLQRVRVRLDALPKPPPGAARARVEAMLLNAYAVAEAGGEKGPQASAMVQAARNLAELDGVLGKHVVEHSGPNGGPIPMAGLAVVRVVRLPELEPPVPDAGR